MAKSRAQRKAERRKREAQQARQAEAERRDESQAQHRTQVPESADVVEAELAEQGADLDALKEESARPEAGSPESPSAPAPSRADVGKPAEDEAPREPRRERRRREREEEREKEERRKAREKKPAEVSERQRGAITGFIVSCWAELKRVQWPDRETLIQASAVTVIFVAVMAAYLGALDAVFNELVQLLII